MEARTPSSNNARASSPVFNVSAASARIKLRKEDNMIGEIPSPKLPVHPSFWVKANELLSQDPPAGYNP